jgi:F-type H+-transporting ATPase subunit b
MGDSWIRFDKKMRAAGLGCILLLASLAIFGCGGAQEKHEPATKYVAMIRHPEEDVEVEREFNLADPKEVEELSDRLKKGEVESLQVQKPINILALSWDLGLWTVVVFGLLLYVLRKLAWVPWLDATRRREDNIRQALEEAQRARDEAQRLRTDLQGEMNRAAEKVRDIMDKARQDAHQATEETLARARAEIQKDRERLHREIAIARDQALQTIWNQTAQLATLISAKAIRRQLTMDDHRRLVDDAITELRRAGEERQREVAGVLS